MPNPVEGLLEVYKDMVEVLLVLEIFLKRICRLKICSVVLLLALKPACSSAMTFSACCFNLLSMIFSTTLLMWLMRPGSPGTAAQAVLALLQVAFLGKCDD